MVDPISTEGSQDGSPTTGFHWAWIILSVCFVNLFLNYGIRLGFGVVLPEMIPSLGLTRTQLRGCLGIEGVLLALIGAVVGLGLGVLYGWTGSRTLIGAEEVPTLLEIPWLPIGGVLLATLLAGLLASVLPARRAVRLAPAQLLAAD